MNPTVPPFVFVRKCSAMASKSNAALQHPMEYIEAANLPPEFTAFTSAITIYQLLVEPYRSGHEAVAERVEMLVAAVHGLEIVPVSATIARQAAQVKAQIGGELSRAIQIATALAGDSEIYVTRRSTLRRIAGLGVAQLDAYRRGESDGPAAP